MSIKIYNLITKKYEEENVCAEGSLRFLYGNPLGGFLVWAIFKRAFFSRFASVWADSKNSAKSIKKFIKDNSINEKEFLKDPKNFATFNDFFTRALSYEARPVHGADGIVSFPADGRHLLVRNVGQADSFYVKGQRFNLAKFFKDKKLAARFEGADMLISRLSPVDYHRFHYPISGEIIARKKINGALFSVSPIALMPKLSILWENKRVLNMIDSKEFGLCAFVEIGATNVGSIVNYEDVGSVAMRGNQAGCFRLGGSCVVTLFPSSTKLKWDETLVEMSKKNVECYAHVNMTAAVLE